MRFRSFTLAIAAICLLACTKVNVEKNVRALSITCEQVEGNVLRVDVSTVFSSECEYDISYWRKDMPSEMQTIRKRHSEGKEGHAVLMFLYPESTYCFKVNMGEDSESDVFEFQTGTLPADMPHYSVNEGAGKAIPGYIFQTQISKPGYITIADTDGNIVWYQYIDQAARMFDFRAEDGVIWLLTGFKEDSDGDFQRLTSRIMCIDLYGNILRKWSIVDNEIDIPYAHHEIRVMPDGNIAVVSNFTREYDLTPLGGDAATTLYGDGFVIFNKEGKVVRTWNFLDRIDPLGCSFIQPMKRPLDLLHANSFNYDSEGNYYMTFNASSQLWKIDSKTGEILYILGPDGNVELDESGFAQGLHAAVPLAPDRVLCLDNGRERKCSRAVIYRIDPDTKKAEVELSVMLPKAYSSKDRSNVELIADNTMLMFGMTVSHYVVFTDLEGNIIKSLERNGMSYRTHYLPELPEY